ncbi:molybdopterin-binding protein [Phorcysia thermohydrogeniphila]|uniref:Molybdopterin molybdenumtransferase n=1 Tax=Phorcysia thermohydrogeniphila TaxID=936138 RepID=A0A4R1GHM2_9BACT|nr:molybdopterin-binding protein [Phorcysia thermohydrogeniphila]TCK06235.1 molybdenum cofactor synthesis domain-containing protein [Phorcysia thermohydrogeniphila]
MKKKVKVEDAVGMVLVHDITEVDLDRNFKGRVFKKGHIIRPEDVEKLKRLGKDYIYVLELSEDEIHENDAAVMLAEAIMGENTYRDEEPVEGKINIYSSVFGVVKIDVERLLKINMIGEPSCPTIHNNMYVKPGDKIAAVRIISLVAPKKQIEEAVEIARGGIIRVVPFKEKTAGIIITGNEVYYGRIKDKFYERLKPKLEFFKCSVKEKVILPDDKELIKQKILEFADKYDVVVLTGGTSVDPDDVTYLAVKEAGTQNFIRGNPIQPGNMLSMGWLNGKPIIAVPAAALFFKATSFDIWLPRLLIGDVITREEVAMKSHGGLCHSCPVCVFPICPFGRP